MLKIDTNRVNKYLKDQCQDQIYVILVMHILLLNERLLLQEQVIEAEKTDLWHLKIMHHLLVAFPKSNTH